MADFKDYLINRGRGITESIKEDARAAMAEKPQKIKGKLVRPWTYIINRGFLLILVVFLIMGSLFFLRPKTSVIEKRDLAQFPKLTVSSLWDGSFFSDVVTWYADTFPAREAMMSAKSRLENLYGIRGEELIVNSGAVSDEIPVDGEVGVAPTIDLNGLAEKMEDAEELPDGAVHDEPEAVGTIYIADNRGFGVYYFSKDNIDAYASMVNTVRANLDSSVNVYAIPTPDNFGVCLDQTQQEALSGAYEGDAFDYIFKVLDPSVKGVNVFPALVKHNAEYVYFYTDHHWTALGAYYAYREFCKAKGFEAHAVTDYEEKVYPDFLGTFYAYSNQSPALAENPDTIHAYVPISTNTTSITGRDGTVFDYPIIQDGSTYDVFIGSDQPLEEINNPTISDGSACLLIKDSYGNCFAPFLVDHYDKVYVVDFRAYYGNLTQLIAEKGIDDVIFMNNIEFLAPGNAQTILSLF